MKEEKMGVCKLCGKYRELIKAHIFPRQVYTLIRQVSTSGVPGNQVPKEYRVGTNQHPKQWQSGIYDSCILCGECDNNLIGPWDKYGQKILLDQNLSGSYIRDSFTDTSAAFIVNDIDYIPLKLFFISLLLRASITSEAVFNEVQLGPWEATLKKMILDQEPGQEDDFSVIIFKYVGTLSEVITKPFRIRIEGVNFYELRIPRYKFLIKVDKRSCPLFLSPFILSPSKALVMIVQDFQSTPDFKQILMAAGQIQDQPNKSSHR